MDSYPILKHRLIADPKRRAAVDFTARLLKSPVGPSVARVILFGSVARGEAQPESDVDVLVFGGGPRDSLSEWAAQAAWDATVESGEQVAQLTYGLGELFQPRSYLIYHALKRGEELYAMDEAEVRRMEAGALLRKGNRHLDQAQRSAENEDFELALVGAYTATELIARAYLLLLPDIDLPSSHGGMLQMFSREFIKTGKVPKEWGRALNRGLEARSHALYDATWIADRDNVQPVLDLARGMIEHLERDLSQG